MLSEVRFATRGLMKWRFGAVAAVLTLSIGIGAAAAIYALLRAGLDPGPDIPDSGRVARLYAASPTFGVERGPVSLAEVTDVLSRASAFETIGAYVPARVRLDVETPTAVTPAVYVSPGVFPIMQARASVGRTFMPADFDDSPVAVVSERLWRGRLNGASLDTAILTVDGTPRRIVGVLPATFAYRLVKLDADVWLPLERGAMTPVVSVIGRLRADANWQTASAELDRLARTGHAGSWTWRAIPVQQDMRRRERLDFAATFGGTFVVLLIASINVACLLMARGVHRLTELSTHRALGATRRQVARLLLAEHAAVAIAGAAGGTAVACALTRFVSSVMAPARPEIAERVVTGAALVPIALTAAAFAWLLFGVLPAMHLSRRGVADWLKGLPSLHRARIAGFGPRDLIAFVELACASVLVLIAVMWLQVSSELQRVTPGFSARQIVGIEVPGESADLVSARLRAVPGVSAVTRTGAPLGGRGPGSTAEVARAGGPIVRAAIVPVGDRFLETLGLPIVRGRTFETLELTSRAPVAVLSESAARAIFASADPIGGRIAVGARTGIARATVIGVSRDAVRYGSLVAAGLAQPDVYVPYETDQGGAFLLVRVTGDATAMLRPLADAARLDHAAHQPQPIALGNDTTFVTPESAMAMRLFVALGLLTLLLAGTGIFAVVSQSVALRTRELGVRLALGATPWGVTGMILSRESQLIAAGFGIGALFTLAYTSVFLPNLFAIGAPLVSTWLCVLGLCGGTAALACALATRSIVRMAPAVVLRRN